MSVGYSKRRVRPRRDFPYYSGKPVVISAGGWVMLLASIAVAFILLTVIPGRDTTTQLLAALLFVGIPLVVLNIVSRGHANAMFRGIRLRDYGIILLTALASMAASVLAALMVRSAANVAANPLASEVRAMTTHDYVLRLAATAPQLLGEELLTLLPFLAVLWLATHRLRLGRRAGLVAALAVSTLIFSAAHLPTYDWNYAQCFGVIGAARVVLTISYMITRNLWVSTLAHIINDWAEFSAYFLMHPHQ